MKAGSPYDSKEDVWAFGVLLYYLVTRELPQIDSNLVIEKNEKVKNPNNKKQNSSKAQAN